MKKSATKRILTRHRVAMGFGVMGIVLMGVDLLTTRNFFVHIGELMVASLLCLVIAIALDYGSSDQAPPEIPKP